MVPFSGILEHFIAQRVALAVFRIILSFIPLTHTIHTQTSTHNLSFMPSLFCFILDTRLRVTLENPSAIEQRDDNIIAKTQC